MGTFKTHLKVILKALCSTIMAGLVIYLSIRVSPSQSEAPAVAFMAEYTETSLSPQTGVSAQKHMFRAVRSDGSTALGSTDNPEHERLVKDFPRKLEIVIADHAKLKTTYDYSSEFAALPARPRRVQSPTCQPRTSRVQKTFLGEDTIEGYRAYHYQASLKTYADGTTQDGHYWYAPALDCFEVQLKAYKRDGSGTLTGVFEKKITRVQVGEPPPALFDIPAEYREVKPSELERAALAGSVRAPQGDDAAEQLSVPKGVQQHWDDLDQRYESVRNKRLPNQSAPH